MYQSIVNFIFGVVASQLVTDIGKYSIGRLRPNFIDVCKPNIDFSNCAKYNHSYIEDYVCTGTTEGAKNDAILSRVSFPSGHSSFSAYTMLYCAIYIQIKWIAGRSSILKLLKHGAQLVCILLAYFTAISRVMDNKHHWSDVTAGALIGSTSAALTARYVSYLLPTPSTAAVYRVPSREMNNGQGFEAGTEDIEAPNPSRTPKEQSVPANRPI
jgi:phosphatidate phosphatase